MAIGRVGWRAYVPSQTQTISSLLTGLYSAWDGDITGASLDTSIFGAWNGEVNNNVSVKNAWNANGNAIDSKGGANGTIAVPSGASFTTGTMTYDSGKLGSGSFTFDGTNFINLPNNTLSFTGDFTVSCWFYTPTNYVANGSLVSAFDNKSSYPTYYGWNFSYDSTNKCIGFSISNPSGGSYANVGLSTPNNSIIPGQWNHVIITRKFNTRSRIYINGILSASNTSTLNPTYNFGLSYIGAIFYGFQQPYYNKPNAGLKIDSIYTFEAELDQTAVTELYNSGNGQEYPFTISNALIASPGDAVSTNHGTLNGGLTYTTGKVGNGFLFNGTNSYVSFPTNSWNSLVGTDLTISLWVNLSSTANQTLISNMSTPSINVWNGWEIRIVSGQPIFYSWNNSGTGQGVVGSTLTTNTWYNIVATKRGTSYKIYINGSLYTSSVGTGDAIVNGTFYPNIGHLQYSSSYHGLYTTNGSIIDGVNLWSRELSLTEVSALYNAGNGTQYPYTSKTLATPSNKLGIDNGTLMNGCSIVPGKVGNAFSFDGVNDYVALPDKSLNLTESFSISAWFKTAGTIVNAENYILCNQSVNAWYTNPNGFTLDQYGNSVRFAIFNNTNTYTELIVGYTFTPNTWYHITATKQLNGNMKVYLNGTLIGTKVTTVNPTFLTTYHKPSIGAMTIQGTPNNPGYLAQSGFMVDALNVWTKELTQSEVTELYNSGNGKQIEPTSIVTSGLVLNLDASRKSSYPNTGTTWYDISGSGNNGTMVNGVAYGSTASGVMSFDGVNDYVNIGTSANLRFTKNFTINIWFKFNTKSGVQTLISNNESGGYGIISNYNSEGFVGTAASRIVTFYHINGTYYLVGDSLNNYTINTWYNITTTYDGNTIKYFRNGVLIDSYSVAGSITITSEPLVIGCNPNSSGTNFSDFFNGDLGQTMIYNRVLSSTEITQNFNATKSRFGL